MMSGHRMAVLRRAGGLVSAALVGAAVARGVRRRMATAPPGGSRLWERENHRGATVTLAAGPGAALGAAAGAALARGTAPRARSASVLAATAAAGAGLYDDLTGGSDNKGLRGHLTALGRGEITSGTVKLGVIGAAGMTSAAMVSDRAFDALVGGAAVAGHANLLNLLDLRPGRAIKVALLHAPAVLRGPAAAPAAAALGAAAALLPDDLAERTMLGDAGANALGAVLGLAMVAREGRVARLVHLAVVTGLTLASERVSFTDVIQRTPLLRELDELGRLPR